MMNKITSASEAADLIHDGDTVTTSGFVGIGVPDELLAAIEKRFLETGHPRTVTRFRRRSGRRQRAGAQPSRP